MLRTARSERHEIGPFYVRFTDLYVQWSRDPALVVTAGKQSIPFTQEGATSSKELPALLFE